MYELVQVSEKCYYINCPAKIGVYIADKDNVYLVDSGNDKDAGRKVRQILEKNGWHLVAILNTHSNADHIGGNKYLQGQTGCKIILAVSRRLLQNTRSWSRLSCTAVIRVRI